MGRLQMKVSVVGRDPTGRIIFRKSQICRSYVLAEIDLIYAQMQYGAHLIPDTGNVNRNIGADVNNLLANAGAGNVNYGIRVGTSSQAVAISDYHLIAAIAQGVGAGQLQHGAMSYVAPSTVGSTRRFTCSRTFTNGSGADITVNEVGIYACGGTTPYYFCIERSLLTFTVPNGASRTVTYTISVTV